MPKKGNEKIANLFDKGKEGFISIIEGVQILGNKIKLAIFAGSQPLQISDVKVIPLSSNSVEITWKTNHKATSKVNYGLTRIYDREQQDSKKVKDHSIILTGLKPGATYHYEMISQNKGYVYDADRVFVTPEK